MKNINHVPAKLAPSGNFRSNPERNIGLVERRLPMRTVMLGQRRIRLYSISWLGRLANKRPRTIHAWEAEGLFPTPLLKLSDGYRWYTAMEIEAYSRLIKMAGMRRCQGRPRKGVKPQSAFLKENAFEVKRQLKEILGKTPEKVPEHVQGEDAILQSAAKSNHIKMSHDTLVRLINQSLKLK